MKVREAMRSHVVTTTLGARVYDVVDLMDLYQVRCVPVLDSDKRLVGIVTERDIADLLLPQIAGSEPISGDAGVTSVMASPVWSIDDGAELAEASRVMLAREVTRLPVTCGGRVVGMISRIDICEAALEDACSTEDGE
jgi:CBS domain-containing protein